MWNADEVHPQGDGPEPVPVQEAVLHDRIGIAGCTALLVTGFGVKDSISDIVHLQFDELNQYQLIVALKDESALEGRDLQAISVDDSQVEDYLTVLQDSSQVVPRGGDPVDDVTIFVPSDVEKYHDYFQFRERNSHDPVEFTEDSVVITENWRNGSTCRWGIPSR